MNTLFDAIVAIINRFFGLIRLSVVVMIVLSGTLSILAGNISALFGCISLLVIAVMFFEIYRVLCLKDKEITVEIPDINKPQ